MKRLPAILLITGLLLYLPCIVAYSNDVVVIRQSIGKMQRQPVARAMVGQFGKIVSEKDGCLLVPGFGGWISKDDVASPEQAVVFFDAMYRKESSKWLTAQAFAYYGKKDWKDAADVSSTAIGLYESGPSYYIRGLANWKLGNLEKSIDDLSSAMICDKRRDAVLTAYIARATVFAQANRFDDASNDVAKVLEIEPSSLVAICLKANLLSGWPEANKRNSAEAIRLASKACELSDQAVIALVSAANAYSSIGDYEKAQERTQQAMDAARQSGGVFRVDAIVKRLDAFKARIPYRINFNDIETLCDDFIQK